jgi:hypothetical protein
MVGENKRQTVRLLGGATIATLLPIVGALVTASIAKELRLLPLLVWGALLIILNVTNLRLQARSHEESPDAIKGKVSALESGLRSQVRSRSYGARRNLIEAPLRELDLDITPRLGWVRDPRLVEPEPVSEKLAGIVAAFESSKRRLLIVGEPGSGKTMAAYSLIEHLDKVEEAEGRLPLLVNLSAWEAQGSFQTFLVDYLCSSVGYNTLQRAIAAAFVSSRRYSLILDGPVADVLDTSRWDFYILSTRRINDEFGNQKSVGLRRIQSVTQATNFQQIKDRADLALREGTA